MRLVPRRLGVGAAVLLVGRVRRTVPRRPGNGPDGRGAPPVQAVGGGARPEVSVLEVAPAVLQALGVEPPSYMAQPAVLAELLPA